MEDPPLAPVVSQEGPKEITWEDWVPLPEGLRPASDEDLSALADAKRLWDVMQKVPGTIMIHSWRECKRLSFAQGGLDL